MQVSCEMIHPGHPDDPHGEKPCVNPAIGITTENVLVCKPCAGQQVSEGFAVLPYPARPRDLLFPFAHPGDGFRFSYPRDRTFDKDLVVTNISGFQPEDYVYFSDGTYTKQKHIGHMERLEKL